MTRHQVFVDSGAWIALVAGRDRYHNVAALHAEALAAAGTRLLTSNYVVTEAVTRLRYDVGIPATRGFRDLLRRGVDQGSLRLRWIDAAVEAAAWDLVEARPEVKLSLTDATSAVIMQRAKITQVFGFDADFRALGFEVQPEA